MEIINFNKKENTIYQFPEFHLKVTSPDKMDVITTGTDDEIFTMFYAYFKTKELADREIIIKLINIAFKQANNSL